jgi:arylformamidase
MFPRFLVVLNTTALVALSVQCASANDATEPTQAQLPPTHAEVSYSTHDACKLDIWIAEGEGPRPLLVYIHGGGWVAGDKKRKTSHVKPYLEKGISYAAINYRHTPQHPLPAPVHDAARAIQFLRSKASEWNIRKDRVALTGGSAGACTSTWLLYHDDLANPDAHDPVRRESTRVSAAAVASGQTSIDPKQIEPWLGPNVLTHRMIWFAVGAKDMQDALDNYEFHKATYKEFSAYSHITADDPPLLMTFPKDMTLPSKDAGHGIHHGMFGVKVKEKADELALECHLLIPGTSESEQYDDARLFLLDKLLAP